MSESKKPITIWLFGNITHDSKILNSEDRINPVENLGGGVTFGSLAINHFFRDSKMIIFSVGIPEDQSLFENTVLINSSTKNIKLTQFTHDYNQNPRKTKLQYYSDQNIKLMDLEKGDIPDLILIQPVYREIDEKLILILKSKFPRTLIYCDLQGWFREITKNNIITQRKRTLSRKIMQNMDFIKLSMDDLSMYNENDKLKLIQEINDCQTMVGLTGGEKGAIIIEPHSKRVLYSPSYAVEQVIDPTGAGDVFISIFARNYLSTKNVKHSLASSSVICSYLIQTEGMHFKNQSINILEDIKEQMNNIEEMSIGEGLNKLFSS